MAVWRVLVNSGARVMPRCARMIPSSAPTKLIQSKARASGEVSRLGDGAPVSGLEMPAVRCVAPGDRGPEPIGQDDHGQLGNHGELRLAEPDILNHPLIDVAKEEREVVPARAIGVLGARGPSPPPPLERFTDAIDRNRWALGRGAMAWRLAHPEKVDVL